MFLRLSLAMISYHVEEAHVLSVRGIPLAQFSLFGQSNETEIVVVGDVERLSLLFF